MKRQYYQIHLKDAESEAFVRWLIGGDRSFLPINPRGRKSEMAHFPNLTSLDIAQEENCRLCVNWRLREYRTVNEYLEGCPVDDLHAEWDYDAGSENRDETKDTALEALWPMDEEGICPLQCAMFYPREAETPNEPEAGREE